MSVPCTKELLLSLIEDIDLIARELIENSVAPKQNRMAAPEHKAVTELLVAKDKELKAALKLAAEQGEVEKEIECVRAEVAVQDQHIRALQGQLKEAETLLASTIYTAKQKLANISRSTPVLSEDLIKYSHRISASNAVCAPLNWQQGDPRRPYPTDLELRSGWLSRAELPLAQQLQHVAAQGQSQAQAPASAQAAGQFSWSGGEVVMGVGGGAPPVPIDTGARGGLGEEVEVMSTESSSSSSTDSN
jgi:mediator of RNA polymerase II transcription subunit 4